jgi:glycerate-2-kinase
MDDHLRELNKEQREAALHMKGAILIVAGAGAGKTKTITHRIVNLIKNGVAPEKILAVTFTNKAAKEMRERINLAIKNSFAGNAFSNGLAGIGTPGTEDLEKTFLGSVSLAAGEPSVVVPKNAGKGGRNLHMALEAIKLKLVKDDSVFISFASDGMDNSDAAGAIVDKSTIEKAEKLGLDVNDYSARFDSYNFFKKTGDIILTGPTGANVSDLMVLLSNK